MEEKRKINITLFQVCLFLFGILLLVGFVHLFVHVLGIDESDMEKWIKVNNTEQENVEERFTAEYQETGIGIYHDNELNVTCYSTGVGLSCIPDAEIGRR